MASLATSLQSILRDDGTPDIERRRTELYGLVSVLSSSETRMLKQCFAGWTFVDDFIPKLPIEIRLRIADFLTLSELVTIRYVSRQWQQSWTPVTICNQLMKRFFRSVFEHSYMQLSNEEKVSTFIAASERLQAIQAGAFHSMTIRRYDDSMNDEHITAFSPVLDRRYSSGRVAWTLDGGIKVTDLRSGEVQIFMIPNREMVQNWNLSEKWVVAAAGDKAKLYAWPLFTVTSEMYIIRLPSMPTDIIMMQNNSVGFVTQMNEVFIWAGQSRIAGRCALRQLQIINPLPHHKRHREIAVLFHPDRADIIFVIYLTYNTVDGDAGMKGTVQWTVQKYVDNTLIKTIKLTLPLEGLDYKSGDELQDIFRLSPRCIDDNGIYSLASVAVGFGSRFLYPDCNHYRDGWSQRRSQRHLATNVTFDVYEERLDTAFYHFPYSQEILDPVDLDISWDGGNPLGEGQHLWGGQIFLPIIRSCDPMISCNQSHRLPVRRVLLLAIGSCNQVYTSPTCVTENVNVGFGEDKKRWESKKRSVIRDPGLKCSWVGDPHLAYEPLKDSTLFENEQEYEIRGDGTFTVLFGDWGYVVWNYDKSLRLAQQLE
ncbi:MAG: hypothetical protein M1818_004026 [Claussenomyces sp. TS43310]|nr:MAG: hypothetical protein M1818_004026 [Claussenomyces sp. TS43310]